MPNTKGKANEVDAYVGYKIREARKLLGFSQEKMAEQIGLTFQQLQKYESGKNRTPVTRLLQIVNLTKLPVVWFLPKEYGAAQAINMAEISRIAEDSAIKNIIKFLKQPRGRIS